MTQFSAEARRRTYGGGLIVPLLAGVRRNRSSWSSVSRSVSSMCDREKWRRRRPRKACPTAGRSGRSAGPLLPGRGRRLFEESTDSKDAQLGEAVQRAVATAAQGIINAGSKLRKPE